jgi:hypothetical protein
MVGVVMFLLSVGYAANQEGSGSVKSSGASIVDVTGSWAIYYYAETDTKDSMDLTQRGTVLQGIWYTRDTPTPVKIKGSIVGTRVSIVVPLPDAQCRIDAEVSQDGKTMTNGTWIVDSGPYKGTHPWRAEKTGRAKSSNRC